MSDTESFESVMKRVNAEVAEIEAEDRPFPYRLSANVLRNLRDRLRRAHDREIRDTTQQQYSRGYHDGRHSMDAEHRAVAMRLRALPLDGGSHENLSQIARAVYHSDFGWTRGACAALRDKLIDLMGGVSDGTDEPMTTGELIKYVEEDTRRLKSDATGAGDDSDTCDSQCCGACAADCGDDSGEQEVSDGGASDDCRADTGCGDGGGGVHMAGLVGYDVLDNERRKAIANLRKLSERGNVWGRELIVALGLSINASNDDMCDRLIHLLGGDQPSGIDVLREMDEREAGGRITDELRERITGVCRVSGLSGEKLYGIADRIDERAKHDRLSDQLRIEKLEKQRDHWHQQATDLMNHADAMEHERDELMKQRAEMTAELARRLEQRDEARARTDELSDELLRTRRERDELRAKLAIIREAVDG